MAYVNLERARRLMAAAGFDALLIAAPENVYYATGFNSLLATMWYEAGAPTVWALLPADGAPALVVPEAEARGARAASGLDDVRAYPVWIESDALPGGIDADDVRPLLRSAPSGRAKPPARPAFFDAALIAEAVRGLLGARGLLGGRIGVEMDFVSHNAAQRLRATLPQAAFGDGTPLLRELRLIKSEAEIAHLRQAVWLTEQGMRAAVDTVQPGVRHGDIRPRYLAGVAAAARSAGIGGYQGADGGVRVGPYPWVATPDAPVKPGDQIMFDCNAVVHGCHSDVARSFALGHAGAAQRQVQSALARAHAAACAEIRPGRRFCDVFNAGQRAMHAAGFDTYRRGHLGHSVGLYILEEMPAISAAETRELEPGMVLAVELPWYIDGIGGFQCEDVVLVTGHGYENFNTLDHDLIII